MLHVAAQLGLVNVCRFLIKNGANSSIVNNLRSKPIDLATPLVAKLLEEEEEEEPAQGDSDVESQLLEAAKNGDLSALKVDFLLCD